MVREQRNGKGAHRLHKKKFRQVPRLVSNSWLEKSLWFIQQFAMPIKLKFSPYENRIRMEYFNFLSYPEYFHSLMVPRVFLTLLSTETIVCSCICILP